MGALTRTFWRFWSLLCSGYCALAGHHYSTFGWDNNGQRFYGCDRCYRAPMLHDAEHNPAPAAKEKGNE